MEYDGYGNAMAILGQENMENGKYGLCKVCLHSQVLGMLS
jgi:hypothetical protein